MRYDILLFDLDDTILDFAANEKCSLSRLLTEKNIDNQEAFKQVYKRINKELWDRYSQDEIELDEVLCNRFAKSVKEYNGEDIDGIEWDTTYRSYLSEGNHIMNGAIEMLNDLSKTHRLFIATNGVHDTQVNRIKLANIGKYFEKVYDSDLIGYRKPNVKFFEYIFNDIDNFDKSKTLMIGDGLLTDIKGGYDSGIDTCLFAKENPQGNISTYYINELSQLKTIVK